MICPPQYGSVSRIQRAPGRTFYAAGLKENALQHARHCGIKYSDAANHISTRLGESSMAPMNSYVPL
jgi:hypothetical protein